MSEQPQITTIDLIRHGEPQGGVLIRGWQDDPLSEQGWTQMREAVAEHRPWDQIVCSPLARCYDFARELEQSLDIPLSVDERLKELGFGQWEGRDPKRLYQESPEAVSNFWKNPVEFPPPDGEPMTLFQSRVESAWQDIQIYHQGHHVLLVGHGGVNRMIIGKVLGIPLSHLFRMEIPYAAISRICIEQGTPRLVFLGGSLG
jgi:alpha-ribazole phosphatase/probable phosphoglycerate mutase